MSFQGRQSFKYGSAFLGVSGDEGQYLKTCFLQLFRGFQEILFIQSGFRTGIEIVHGHDTIASGSNGPGILQCCSGGIQNDGHFFRHGLDLR